MHPNPNLNPQTPLHPLTTLTPLTHPSTPCNSYTPYTPYTPYAPYNLYSLYTPYTPSQADGSLWLLQLRAFRTQPLPAAPTRADGSLWTRPASAPSANRRRPNISIWDKESLCNVLIPTFCGP